MSSFIVLPLLALKKSLVEKNNCFHNFTDICEKKLDTENALIFWCKVPKIQRKRLPCFSKEKEQYEEQGAT